MNDIFLGSQPFQHPRIAIWIEDNWAFGRIARALSKYANVDVYDWRSCESTSKLWNEGCGPFGIFEASASGLPVMSTPVGNMKNIDGLVLFTTVQEAVQQIQVWNDDITSLQEYTESMTREIRTNWTMKVCVDRFMSTL